MTDVTFVEDDARYEVHAPSGATFTVINEDEVTYFQQRAARYMQDNHFVNVTDLQDLDRLLVMEVMCWRWSVWMSQEHDYDDRRVDLDGLKKSLNDYSKELRLLKKTMGLDKATRDREKGESVSDYIENLRVRAKEFGVMRENQLTRAITLFKELQALVTLHDNCTSDEQREQSIEIGDILDWLRNIAFPEFEELDSYFRKNGQRYWVRTL